MPNLITTFGKIKSHDPCGQQTEDEHGWNLLCKNLNPEMDMDKKVTLLEVLESNGIINAIWSLRCWNYIDYCLLLADIAESVLPIFEKKYPENKRPRDAIQAIRNFKAGKITEKELVAAANTAVIFSSSAYDAAFAAYDAACGACANSFDPVDSVNASVAASGVARKKQWEKIEKLMRDFIKS